MAKVLLGRGFSMKYKLYRSFGNLDKDVRRHELVAVEYGTNLERESVQNLGCAAEPSYSWRATRN